MFVFYFLFSSSPKKVDVLACMTFNKVLNATQITQITDGALISINTTRVRINNNNVDIFNPRIQLNSTSEEGRSMK